MKVNFHSVGVKMWLYFATFAAVLLLLLWLLQTVFLSNFYEAMKVSGISKTADTVARNYGSDDFETTINELAYKNALLIFVTDMEGNILYNAHYAFRNPMDVFPVPPRNPNEPPNLLPRDYGGFLDNLSQSEKGRISYKVSPDMFSGSILVYGLMLPDAVLYISSALDPMDSTTDILRTQLIYVTAIALMLSFVIAFFLSRKLSRPIVRITAAAGKLAEGDYDICFEKGEYAEIDELAGTLNYATSELSKTERLRRELIANISHDFRTPLTMIKAYTEMIRDISGENKEKRELHLNIIGEESDRLSALVDDVLGLSLLQSGSETLTLTRVNICELLNGTLKRFEHILTRDDFHLTSEINEDLYVIADAARLEQVFYNLIGNAVNHSGGKQIKVCLSSENGRICFKITDDGEGIPDEEQHLIWDRYYAKKGGRDNTSGTGLGLAIVKGILELHGADFGVKSEIGAGSMFWFTIKEE